MSAAKWTPEPWEVEPHEAKVFSLDLGLVAIAVNPSPNDSDVDGNREARQNAARIVACVNACAGIPNPEAVRELIDAARRVLMFGGKADDVAAALAKLEGSADPAMTDPTVERFGDMGDGLASEADCLRAELADVRDRLDHWQNVSEELRRLASDHLGWQGWIAKSEATATDAQIEEARLAEDRLRRFLRMLQEDADNA